MFDEKNPISQYKLYEEVGSLYEIIIAVIFHFPHHATVFDYFNAAPYSPVSPL
ncbi:hypothetical protein BB14905_16930 [Bacillus sp. B14905]|nr:hypothetical protein BB14905_16930 [Bacillus sp. B14905]